MSAYFEVVQTDAEQPWHARIIGSNNETVWTTEKYTSRDGAMNAIRVLGDITYKAFEPDNIRDVDERRLVKPEPILCPECAQGKTPNCALVALDPALDDFVPCATTQVQS